MFVVSFVVSFVVVFVVYTLPMWQLCVRHLKAGLKLVTSIAGLGRKCANALIKHGVMEKLSELLVTENMASSLKLLTLRALDSLLNYPQGMERFLGWDREVRFGSR